METDIDVKKQEIIKKWISEIMLRLHLDPSALVAAIVGRLLCAGPRAVASAGADSAVETCKQLGFEIPGPLEEQLKKRIAQSCFYAVLTGMISGEDNWKLEGALEELLPKMEKDYDVIVVADGVKSKQSGLAKLIELLKARKTAHSAMVGSIPVGAKVRLKEDSEHYGQFDGEGIVVVNNRIEASPEDPYHYCVEADGYSSVYRDEDLEVVELPVTIGEGDPFLDCPSKKVM